MIPLRLTGAEQEFLAQMCSLLRGHLYQTSINRPMDPAELRDRIDDLLMRFELKPTQLDSFYDWLHRSGANS